MQNKHIRLKRKKFVRKTILAIVASVFLFIGIILASLNEDILISDIQIKGNGAISTKDIKEIIQAQLEGKYFFLFPKNNIFIYPNSTIESEIISVFKRVYYADVSRIGLTSILIVIKERTPYALWCGDEIFISLSTRTDLLDNNIKVSRCYFLDDKGFIFAPAPSFSNDVYFTVYGKLNSYEDYSLKDSGEIIGRKFLGDERFARLKLLRENFAKEGMGTMSINQVGNGDIEFLLENGGKLIFNEKQNIDKLLNNLTSALNAKITEKYQGGNYKDVLKNLEYIDLRFENKVLFKFRD